MSLILSSCKEHSSSDLKNSGLKNPWSNSLLRLTQGSCNINDKYALEQLWCNSYDNFLGINF